MFGGGRRAPAGGRNRRPHASGRAGSILRGRAWPGL